MQPEDQRDDITSLRKVATKAIVIRIPEEPRKCIDDRTLLAMRRLTDGRDHKRGKCVAMT